MGNKKHCKRSANVYQNVMRFRVRSDMLFTCLQLSREPVNKRTCSLLIKVILSL